MPSRWFVFTYYTGMVLVSHLIVNCTLAYQSPITKQFYNLNQVLQLNLNLEFLGTNSINKLKQCTSDSLNHWYVLHMYFLGSV